MPSQSLPVATGGLRKAQDLPLAPPHVALATPTIGPSFRHKTVPHLPNLARELERRARALGLLGQDLARELGISPSALARVRTGRARVSLSMLHGVARRFPSDEHLMRLAWEYLALGVETFAEQRQRLARESAEGAGYAARLPAGTLAALRGYVRDFPTEALHGQGLELEVLDGADAPLLTACLGFLEAEFGQRRVHVLRRGAGDLIPASSTASLVAAPLLLVDRIDHLREPMAAVLRARAAYGKAIIVTVARPIEDLRDAPLSKLISRRMRTVTVGGTCGAAVRSAQRAGAHGA
jgi:transcriptional regulator with XRE-family HTH domain